MTETFIDQATCSVSLLFSKYCFKLDKHVNKIISDSVALYLVRDWDAATQIKKIQIYVSRNFWRQAGYDEQIIIKDGLIIDIKRVI